MFGYFLLCLVVATAAAQNQVPTATDSKLDNLYKSLELNPEQITAAKNAESQSVTFLAYMEQMGIQSDQISCKSLTVNPKDIKFTLYSMPTKTLNWTGAESGRRLLPYFDPKLPTQILISGGKQAEQIWQPQNLAFTYGIRGNKVNLITVNWNDYANCPYAVTTLLTVPQLASVISDMIENSLVAVNQATYDKIRLTGFGIGAHIAGLSARKLPEKIARLTALDPAGLLYNLLPEYLKLKKGDAKFIDAIFTNQGVYGSSELVGNINFFPSGGRIQRACEKLVSGKNACSHQLAMEYFLESVDESVSGFVAKPADSWAEFIAQKTFVEYSEYMGEPVTQNRYGNFYLQVNELPPYSRGVIGAYLPNKLQPVIIPAPKV